MAEPRSDEELLKAIDEASDRDQLSAVLIEWQETMPRKPASFEAFVKASRETRARLLHGDLAAVLRTRQLIEQHRFSALGDAADQPASSAVVASNRSDASSE